MKIIVRSAVCTDFEGIYPLFEQLWPNKELNKDNLMKVFNRGVDSDTEVFLCGSRW